MILSLNELFRKAISVVPMSIAYAKKPEDIKMKDDSDETSKRIPPPSPTSDQDFETYNVFFAEANVKFVMKWTGKNNGGILDDQKNDWEEANKEIEDAIHTSTFTGPFYDMLNKLVSHLPVDALIVFVFEGDSNDCIFTQAMLKASHYLTEKGYNVHIIACKAMPSKLLINPAFFKGWSDAVVNTMSQSFFDTNWHIVFIGDDSDEITKNDKELYTNMVAHVVVNILSLRFHTNGSGKFTAGTRLMLEEVKVTPTTDTAEDTEPTMEKAYKKWAVNNEDNMFNFFSKTAEDNKIAFETSVNGLVNAVHRK